ncbi:MAG: transglutaminaseTgpA domain-containing protein [Bacteriovoracia bacterium]
MRPWHTFALILAVICFFAFEEISWPSYLVVFTCLVLRHKKIFPPAWFYKLIGVLVFLFAFLKHGLTVNPEMGLNLLLSVVALKLLEAKESRDWRMLTLGSFLLWSTAALFVKTPLFFICALLGLGLAIRALVMSLEEEMKVSWRELSVWVMRALPLSVILFILFPRFSSGLWTPPQRPTEGTVGFSEETRPGDVGELRTTGALAFHASISPLPARDKLYWRGVTMTGHDGWNWFVTAADEYQYPFAEAGRLPSPVWWQQEIIHKKAVRRTFSLDWPVWWEHDGKQAEAGSQGTLRFPSYQSFRRYKAVSTDISQNNSQSENLREALIAPKKLPKELQGTKPQNLTEALARLERFFTEEGFVYSITAGRMTSLPDFFNNKRGWCAHYASSTALILRAWGFPARLVSGYLGGEFNSQGEHFTVSEDDAHVWVEAFYENRWQRIDPTVWIIPERVELDGGEFFRRRETGRWWSQLKGPDWWRSSKMWVDHINFRFLVWSEDFDREKQRVWAGEMKMNLATFYSLGLWTLLGAMVLYWVWDFYRSRRLLTQLEMTTRIWQDFCQTLKQQEIDISADWGPQKTYEYLLTREFANKKEILEWLKSWEQELYVHPTDSGIIELQKKLRGLLFLGISRLTRLRRRR